MAYIRHTSNRLGTFESSDGFSQASGGATSADALNFVSALLPGVANIGMSIYAAKAAEKAAKRQEKLEAQAEALRAAQGPGQVIVQGGGNSGLLIGAIIGGAALVCLVVVLLTKKSGSGAESQAGFAATASTPGPVAVAAPRIKRMKRISRPKR